MATQHVCDRLEQSATLLRGKIITKNTEATVAFTFLKNKTKLAKVETADQQMENARYQPWQSCPRQPASCQHACCTFRRVLPAPPIGKA